MTITKRRCACGCSRVLKQRPQEDAWNFTRRLYASRECAVRARTMRLEPRYCEYEACGGLIVRGRQPSGKLQTPRDYSARKYCSRACANTPKSATSPRRSARAASKPKPAPLSHPTVSKPSNELVAPRALPDPREKQWTTVASAAVENPCPEHPTERASSCTCCNLVKHHQTRKPVPMSTPRQAR